jgi:ribose transport system ATP-binding protein
MEKSIKKRDVLSQQRRKRYWILLGITMAFIVLYSFTIPNYFSIDTITNLIRQSTVLTILACGMTFVILTGGIDLSPGANIAFTGTITALVINATGATTLGSALLGFVVSIAAGGLIGLINGYLVGYLNISAFIVTLATQSLTRGLTLYITNGTRIVVSNEYFNSFGISNFDLFGLKIPIMVIPLVLILLLSYVLLNKSTFGRKTYIIGGNPMAARASGINVNATTMLVYTFMGLMAGVGTIITMGRSASAQPLAANGTEFDVITAVVLGGITLAGGAGTLAGTLLGSLLMGTMLMGVNMINIPVYYNYIIKGTFILFAVLADEISLTFARLNEIRMGAKKSEKKVERQTAKDVEYIGDFGTMSFRDIHKYFPGVQALDEVSFDIKSGTVHAIAGENGAGKSTLMKILSGVYTMDSGEILVDGKRLNIRSPKDAQRKGIFTIFQELTLIQELTVAQNVFLGREIRGKLWFTIAIKQMRKKAKEVIDRFGITIDPTRKAKTLTVGRQQMVEVVRAFSSKARVMIMDEPTSALSESDKNILFGLIRELKKQGIAVIYISHRIQELFEIADAVTILRDGKHIATLPMSEVDENKLVRYMVNREIKDVFSRERAQLGEEVLRVEHLSRQGVFNDISFTVRAGEVVCMAGLIGAGRSEVARCIFGLDKPTSGEIYLRGKKVKITSPNAALQEGICYVSEDRKREGIIPLMSVRENISSATLDKISRAGLINGQKEKNVASKYIDQFSIKTPSDTQLISNLSGGNQQKCCLARMFACDPKLIIFDEPTRGVDVGAKAEIHKLIEKLAKSGIAIIMISSELPEIIGTNDKIIVMAGGNMTAVLDHKDDMSQEELMYHATRLTKSAV